MHIGGFQKFSLIDYPGKTSAILFTTGCNFRCRYCHNPELVIPEQFAQDIPLTSIYSFLKTRKGKLDAVTITGGEPTHHNDLLEMIQEIKSLGFLIKLDSNGSRPEVLKSIIDKKLVDYLAMDIKAPLPDYAKIMGWKIPVEILRQSIQLIMNSGIEYEFRTTIVKAFTSKDDLKKIAKTIQGAKKYFLQRFSPATLIDNNCNIEKSYSIKELEELAKELQDYIIFCGIR